MKEIYQYTLKDFVFTVLKQRKAWFFTALFIGFCQFVPYLFWPIYMKYTTEALVELDKTKVLLFSTFFPLITLGFVTWLFFGVPYKVNAILASIPLSKTCAEIRQRLLEVLYQQAPNYYHERFVGSLATNMRDLSEGVVDILNQFSIKIIPAIIYILLLSTMLFTVHWLYVVILFVYIAVNITVNICTYKSILAKSSLYAERRSVVMGKIVDSLVNIDVVRNLVLKKTEMESIQKSEDELIIASNQSAYTKHMIGIVYDFINTFTVFIVMYGVFFYLFLKGQISASNYLLLSFAYGGMMNNISALNQTIIDLYNVTGVAEDARKNLLVKPSIADSKNSKDLVVVGGQVEIRHLSFAYKDQKNVLSDLNLRINSGEKLGIVGYSGAGKSTLVHMLLRLMQPNQGSILIDGQDIAEVTQDSLRRSIAFIPQDVSLFHRTIKENIVIANPLATEEELLEASIQSGADEFISKLEHGYDSLVGERGVKLSGGQKQRIAIARAFLQQAPILILDEATSALDSITESLIQQALDKTMAGRTTFVIAHRLSTLQKMDRIIVLDEGRIIEQGTHEYLLNHKGVYARMWNMQVNGFLPLSQA